jgi:GcrA cell cycle regulator
MIVHGTPWPEERVERLKQCVADKMSASQIAANLGGVTRNAVIGKIARLGLCLARGPNGRLPGPPRPRARARPPKSPRNRPWQQSSTPIAPTPPPPAVLAPASSPVTFMDLDEKCQCHWPLDRKLFCGAPRCPTARLPYCDFHSGITMR